MKIGNTLFLAIVIPTLFACGSTSKNNTASAKENTDGLICKSEKVLGSKIAKRVCRTPQQIEAEMIATQTAARKMRSGGNSDGNSF